MFNFRFVVERAEILIVRPATLFILFQLSTLRPLMALVITGLVPISLSLFHSLNEKIFIKTAKRNAAKVHSKN
jgi:hypothetical protein